MNTLETQYKNEIISEREFGKRFSKLKSTFKDLKETVLIKLRAEAYEKEKDQQYDNGAGRVNKSMAVNAYIDAYKHCQTDTVLSNDELQELAENCVNNKILKYKRLLVTNPSKAEDMREKISDRAGTANDSEKVQENMTLNKILNLLIEQVEKAHTSS